MSFLARLSERTLTPGNSVQPPVSNRFVNQANPVSDLEPSMESIETEMPMRHPVNESPVQSTLTSSEPRLMRLADPTAPQSPAESLNRDLTPKTTLMPVQAEVQSVRAAERTVDQDSGPRVLNESPVENQQQPLAQTNLHIEQQTMRPTPSLFNHPLQQATARDSNITQVQPSVKAHARSIDTVEPIQPIRKPIEKSIMPRPQPERQSVKQSEPTPTTPAIRVTIGRLEVRAMMPAAPTPVKATPTPTAQPQVTLEAYLSSFRGSR
jgi:hypothetical protein